MDTVLRTPAASELTDLAEVLAGWQVDDGQVQLHPGDLGWYSMRGADATAEALRIWSRDGGPLAMGLLDGEDLLRLALDPEVRDDVALARQVCADVVDPGRGVLPAGSAVVESRGAVALQQALRGEGWVPDEPWTPLCRNLSESSGTDWTDLEVEEVGPERAGAWMEVHHSAFRGTPLSEEERAQRGGWWEAMMSGPFGESGRMLAVVDADTHCVAVVGVWSAGRGRPGLVEPLGVHRDHRGRGYGVAACAAAAASLRAMGASSAVVAAESSNAAAVATYVAAGFTAGPEVADLVRPG